MKPLQKLPKNVRDLGKLIVAKGFKKLPKVQKIVQSGHTGGDAVHQKIICKYRMLARCTMFHINLLQKLSCLFDWDRKFK